MSGVRLSGRDFYIPRRCSTPAQHTGGGPERVVRSLAAGVADRLGEVADIVKLVEAAEAKPAKRGPYRKSVAA
jgi:hypothetical protein